MQKNNEERIISQKNIHISIPISNESVKLTDIVWTARAWLNSQNGIDQIVGQSYSYISDRFLYTKLSKNNKAPNVSAIETRILDSLHMFN